MNYPTTNCIECNKELIIVQPILEIKLGISPSIENPTCDKCYTKAIKERDRALQQLRITANRQAFERDQANRK